MRDMPIIKLSIFIVVVGVAIGGWRLWQAQHITRALAASGDSIARIELLTTADKASWVRSQVYLFNYNNYKRWHVAERYVDSRAAMEQMLAGAEKPVLWSPESPIWIARACEVWRRHHIGGLVQMDDSSSCRV